MKDNAGFNFSLSTMLLVFTCAILGLLWWQDHIALQNRIALERQNQRVVIHDIQRRLLGFTMFQEEDDYVFELSEKEERKKFKLSEGELDFVFLIQFIGCWESAIEDKNQYYLYMQDCRNNCFGIEQMSDLGPQKQPAEIVIASEKKESYDKFLDDCFPQQASQK